MEILEQLSKETKLKFCACFHLPIQVLTDVPDSIYKRWKLHDEIHYLDKGINISAFKRFLITNDMEEYSSLLMHLMNIQLKMNKLPYKGEFEENQKAILNDYWNYKRDITASLIILLSNEEGNLSITFQNSKNSYIIDNDSIVESIIKGLLKEYKRRDLNIENLTVQEAEEAIKEKEDLEWIENWLMEKGQQVDPFLYEGIDQFISNEMITEYAEEHYITREVDLEYLKNNIKILEQNSKRKAGAKPKNNGIAILARGIANLKRIDKYISNQEDIESFEQMKISDSDCKFIHDCLLFFGLIDDYSMNKNSTTPAKYIRILLKQSKRQVDFFFGESINELRAKRQGYIFDPLKRQLAEINKLKKDSENP